MLCFGWIDGIRIRVDDEVLHCPFRPKEGEERLEPPKQRAIRGAVGCGAGFATGARGICEAHRGSLGDLFLRADDDPGALVRLPCPTSSGLRRMAGLGVQAARIPQASGALGCEREARADPRGSLGRIDRRLRGRSQGEAVPVDAPPGRRLAIFLEISSGGDEISR